MAVRRSDSILEPIVLYSIMHSVTRGWWQQSPKSKEIIPLHSLSSQKRGLNTSFIRRASDGLEVVG